MKNLFRFLLPALLFASCSSTISGLFKKKTPHEEYASRIDDTPAGREWLAVSERSLSNPVAVDLPYKHHGFFPAGKPHAISLGFSAKKGEQLTFNLDQTRSHFVLYAELFKLSAGSAPSLVHAADTSASAFSYDIDETGSYVLRLQPQLSASGDYNLNVTTGPSLGFPVAGTKASIGSLWGDDRDAGQRRHEGIDIFAPKHTPAVAAADGVITGVREGGLGGKTVWLRPSGKDFTLYYAHLDAQLVAEGQTVKKGDTLGLVGNTGNARTTPSHLHFGIYTNAGAIDPLLFVKRTNSTAPSIPNKELTQDLKLSKEYKVPDGSRSLPSNTVLTPLAVNAKTYVAELPDGSMIQVPFSYVQVMKKA